MGRARHGDWRFVKTGESSERQMYVCIRVLCCVYVFYTP